MTAFVLLIALGFVPGDLALPSARHDTKEEFEKLDLKRDHAAIVQLWREHPFEVLFIIDSYLEGSLAAWEKSPEEADRAAIAALHAKALRGARAADEAFGRVIFTDYAASFIGWDAEQKKSFRGGQAAHKRSRAALRDKDFVAALAAADECLALARPLGDWWGTAMGWAARGAALEGEGKKEEALTAYSVARLLYHDLGLGRSELGNLASAARLLVELGRGPRAQVAIERARELAKATGQEQVATYVEDLARQLVGEKAPASGSDSR